MRKLGSAIITGLLFGCSYIYKRELNWGLNIIEEWRERFETKNKAGFLRLGLPF
jgi:hypothetical protein